MQDVSQSLPARPPPSFDGLARLALSARSNSSMETPRTGGYTARSSGGERGTPRDPQRLALGERPASSSCTGAAGPPPEAVLALPRPPAEGCGAGAGAMVAGVGGYPPILSPQHTGRSTSEWSRTPPSSSQGDGLSSRDSWAVGGFDDAGASAAGLGAAQLHAAPPAMVAQPQPPQSCYPSAFDPECPKHHHDLSKRLEVMRFVIMRENAKLSENLQRTLDSIAELRDLAGKAPAPAEQDALQLTSTWISSESGATQRS
eukprot:TRINITY_DN65762_c0_g1_i1.p1 TRINITY_DN65762_c0_g1~~TRINITY_DN65762_c0_g1_i1.p1  ORF type:complete len:259 (-),score=60.59 TRINITY_DN65762_c0_g1_i1:19-795(-)